MVLNKQRDGKAPVILAVNKVDNVQEKADLLPHLQFLASQMNFLDIVPISAETGLNVDTIAAIVRKHLPEATHHFPEDYITDRSQRFMASEIIREKLMRFLGAELPYSLSVKGRRRWSLATKGPRSKPSGLKRVKTCRKCSKRLFTLSCG